MTDFGTDLQALTTLPDPEIFVSGHANVAYGIARRWLTPYGAWDEIGYPDQVTTLDLREQLGARLSPDDLTLLQAQLEESATEDERVQSIDLSVTFSDGTLTVDATPTTADGPFHFILSVSAVSASLIYQGA